LGFLRAALNSRNPAVYHHKLDLRGFENVGTDKEGLPSFPPDRLSHRLAIEIINVYNNDPRPFLGITLRTARPIPTVPPVMIAILSRSRMSMRTS